MVALTLLVFHNGSNDLTHPLMLWRRLKWQGSLPPFIPLSLPAKREGVYSIKWFLSPSHTHTVAATPLYSHLPTTPPDINTGELSMARGLCCQGFQVPLTSNLLLLGLCDPPPPRQLQPKFLLWAATLRFFCKPRGCSKFAEKSL